MNKISNLIFTLVLINSFGYGDAESLKTEANQKIQEKILEYRLNEKVVESIAKSSEVKGNTKIYVYDHNDGLGEVRFYYTSSVLKTVTYRTSSESGFDLNFYRNGGCSSYIEYADEGKLHGYLLKYNKENQLNTLIVCNDGKMGDEYFLKLSGDFEKR
jgi:hypothetical protein